MVTKCWMLYLIWVIFSHDFKSQCLRARRKLWVPIRFKSLGGTKSQLLKVYQTRVRSTLEFASVVFHSGLTIDQSHQIQRVQKKAFPIILAEEYNHYEHALATLNQERLDARRLQLCIKFAIKCTKSPKHSTMFPHNPNYRSNTRNPKPFMEYQCLTSRYYNSPIPYLARLLNKQHQY